MGQKKPRSLTIVAYVRKKAAVHLSAIYHNKMVDENTRKVKYTQLITFYKKTKGDVDTMDQMAGSYTCRYGNGLEGKPVLSEKQ